MSSVAQIAQVHKEESKFRLRPHIATSTATVNIQARGLHVKLRDLVSPKAYQMLKELRLL